MTEDEISLASVLSGLSPDRKIFLLLLLTHNLTISGRAVYSDQRSEAATIQKFYTLNELLHKVSAQSMRLASEDGAAEPDDGFVRSLCALAREGRCEVELRSALKYSLSYAEENERRVCLQTKRAYNLLRQKRSGKWSPN